MLTVEILKTEGQKKYIYENKTREKRRPSFMQDYTIALKKFPSEVQGKLFMEQ